QVVRFYIAVLDRAAARTGFRVGPIQVIDTACRIDHVVEQLSHRNACRSRSLALPEPVGQAPFAEIHSDDEIAGVRLEPPQIRLIRLAKGRYGPGFVFDPDAVNCYQIGMFDVLDLAESAKLAEGEPIFGNVHDFEGYVSAPRPDRLPNLAETALAQEFKE